MSAAQLVEETFCSVEPRLRQLLPELTNDLQVYVNADDSILCPGRSTALESQ